MTDECPNCERPSIGGQIVALAHPVDGRTYAVVCGRCGTVYASREAREQMEGGDAE